MTKTITIEAPDGHVIDSFDKVTGTVTFKPEPLDVKQRINEFIDILRENNLTIPQYEDMIRGMSENTAAYENCKLIVAAYNEGELPDYNNPNQPKFHPRFQLGSSSGSVFSYHGYFYWSAYSHVGARLDYLSIENMKDAVYKFLPYYEKLITA
jgi:hypothetical protein